MGDGPMRFWNSWVLVVLFVLPPIGNILPDYLSVAQSYYLGSGVRHSKSIIVSIVSVAIGFILSALHWFPCF